MTSIMLDIGSPRSVVTFVTVDNKLPYAFVQTILLQHGYYSFVIIRFGPFRLLFINLTVCEWALFSRPTTTLGLVEQAFWKVPPFTKWVVANSLKVILARPSWHSTAGTFSSGTSGSRWFLLTLLHEWNRRRIWWCHFSTLIQIVSETAIVSFHTLPVGIGRPLSENSNNILSAMWSQIPCGLFSSINDHCPIPQLFTSMETALEFIAFTVTGNVVEHRHNRILPVKVSGSSPKMLSRSVILSQSCNVVNPGKMYHSNSVGSPLIASWSL